MNERRCLLLVLLTVGASAQAEPLGRLFFTPAQRAALDQRRQLAVQAEEANRPGPAVLAVNGQVRRSSGRRTTWINGSPLTEAAPLPGGLTPLKVGESIHVESGERSDLLKGGQLTVSRPPSAGRP
jgi:hypothetical protein